MQNIPSLSHLKANASISPLKLSTVREWLSTENVKGSLSKCDATDGFEVPFFYFLPQIASNYPWSACTVVKIVKHMDIKISEHWNNVLWHHINITKLIQSLVFPAPWVHSKNIKTEMCKQATLKGATNCKLQVLISYIHDTALNPVCVIGYMYKIH